MNDYEVKGPISDCPWVVLPSLLSSCDYVVPGLIEL